MSNRVVILVPPERPGIAEPQAWHLGHIVRGVASWTAVPADENVAVSVAAALRGNIRPVILALPSSWCLAATISTAGISRGDHKAMLYRLEERLPLAAEAVVADFIVSSQEPLALGVCVRTSLVRPWVEALESAGVAVKSIVPLALLIAGGAAEPRTTSPRSLRMFACSTGITTGINLIALHGRTPVAWCASGGAAGDVARRRHWMAAMLGSDGALEQLGVDIANGESATAHTLSPVAAALAGAALLDSKGASGIDLRRDALAPADRLRSYRGGLRAVAAAALIFLAAIAVAAFVRESRYRQSAADAEALAVAEVRTAFPTSLGNASMPEIQTMLAQERRSWANAKAGVNDAAGAGGTPGTPTSPAVTARSALRTIRDVVRLLPADADIRIDRSMFDETSFELAGRARSYEDLEKLASAIRAVHPDVSLPASARGPDGAWTFTLKGTTTAATAAR